jgi:hypothetical protein
MAEDYALRIGRFIERDLFFHRSATSHPAGAFGASCRWNDGMSWMFRGELLGSRLQWKRKKR